MSKQWEDEFIYSLREICGSYFETDDYHLGDFSDNGKMEIKKLLELNFIHKSELKEVVDKIKEKEGVDGSELLLRDDILDLLNKLTKEE